MAFEKVGYYTLINKEVKNVRKEAKDTMRRVSFCFCWFFVGVAIFSGSAFAQSKHEKFVKNYAGTETCTVCHKNSAKEMAESLHYLQLGEPKLLVDWPKGKLAGMMDTF